MQYKNLSQLINCDFNITNIKVAKSFFECGEGADYSTNGRRQNLLHLITSGERVYRFNGAELQLKKGAVLFIPDKTYYYTTAKDYNNIICGGIGICFDIYDKNGEKILIEPDIYYEWDDRKIKAAQYFENIDELYKNSPASLFTLKLTLLKLIHALALSKTTSKGEYTLLEPAFKFIAEHYTENLPVSLYAKQCKLSESHFRKKFLEYTGTSPIEYRNEIRFREAKRLYQKKYTMQQIAEAIGFSDAAYLSKMYKRHTGHLLKNDCEIV